MCDLKTFDFYPDKQDLIFEISADRFLHNMVRRLVGTVLNISRFKENPNIINKLLKNRNPSNKLITTFPAKGLYLSDVIYPKEKLTI
jgi:tRNA pseudouridine38-40 synthase